MTTVRLAFLMEGIERVWHLEEGDLLWAQQQLEQRVADIAADQKFVANPGFQCGYCPFADGCPGMDRPADAPTRRSPNPDAMAQ